ncbi:MAG: CPBP family intramembrane metalloprotease [Thermoplasmata archaeon]|nr:CPBP family intramembrane metalloprotease [Thermoplasmata archaeon]
MVPSSPGPAPERTAHPPASARAYALALIITAAAVLSQYVVPQTFPGARILYGSLLPGLLIVYGIPILAFAFLVGADPLRNAFRNLGTAAEAGVRWTGLLLLLSLVVIGLLLTLYARFDPGALHLLSRPNPALQAAASNPYFWIAFSFVIGAVEETIFRGWVFGYWLRRDGPRWFWHALWTSGLFAGFHLYYGTTYGPVAPIQFTTLFLLGFAYAATMRHSGGNLLVIALLHGANDASAFSTLVTPVGADLYLAALILGGLILGIRALVRSGRPTGAAGLPFAPPGPLGYDFGAPSNAPYPWTFPPPPPPGPTGGPPPAPLPPEIPPPTG